MRRVSTFTRAVLALPAANLAVCAALWAAPAGPADAQAPRTPPQPAISSRPTNLAETPAHDSKWAALKEKLSPLEGELGADGLVLLAKALAETGDVARASAVLRRGLARLPESETLWLALIDLSLSLGVGAAEVALGMLGREIFEDGGRFPEDEAVLFESWHAAVGVLGEKLAGARLADTRIDRHLVQGNA